MSDSETYELPPKAHHPSEDKHPGADVGDELWTVGTVEQQLRVDLVTGGEDYGLRLAKQTIDDQREYELENVFTDAPLDERLEHADPFLTHQLQSSRTDEDIRSNRMNWYKMMHSGLSDKVDKATEELGWEFDSPNEQTTFDVHTIRHRDGGTGEYDHAKMTTNSGFDGVTDFEQHGFEYPFAAVVCESASGSKYALLPWYGTVVCTCGSKTNELLKPLCKHEVAALLLAGDSDFTFGESIDPRFRRLTSRQAMVEHTPELPE